VGGGVLTVRRVSPAALAGLVAVGTLTVVNPNTTHLPLCPLHAMTGLWCPLCGSTRAGYALLHGQFGTALADNALFVLALPVLGLLWLRRRVDGDAGPLAPRWLAWTGVVVGLAFGVLRNLPAGSWLAPPG
jgi:hypothetical protein